MASDDDKPLRLREIIGSVFAAFTGVQSQANRERDFARGSTRVWVVAGLVGTALFILVVYLAVKLILALALP